MCCWRRRHSPVAPVQGEKAVNPDDILVPVINYENVCGLYGVHMRTYKKVLDDVFFKYVVDGKVLYTRSVHDQLCDVRRLLELDLTNLETLGRPEAAKKRQKEYDETTMGYMLRMYQMYTDDCLILEDGLEKNPQVRTMITLQMIS